MPRHTSLKCNFYICQGLRVSNSYAPRNMFHRAGSSHSRRLPAIALAARSFHRQPCWSCAVLDVVFLLAGIGLFAITVAYALGCDRL